MSDSVRDLRAVPHPRTLGMRLRCNHSALRHHARLQAPHVIGPAVASALQYAGISVKEAAARTGRPITSIYRWQSGVEQPNFDALWTLGEDFEHGLFLALGRACPSMRVGTTLAFTHSRRLA